MDAGRKSKIAKACNDIEKAAIVLAEVAKAEYQELSNLPVDSFCSKDSERMSNNVELLENSVIDIRTIVWCLEDEIR